MKTKLGVVIIVFLMGMILGAAQPAILYAGPETGGGSLWDPFIDSPPFPGTKLTGTLSIIYNPNLLAAITLSEKCMINGLYAATMFYSVRFSTSSQIYTFVGATEGICLGDIGIPGSGGQGDLIKAFLGNAVNSIFPGNLGWKLKEVKQPGIESNSFGFVADIVIKVNQ